MFTSKKILYLIILCMLLVCRVNGIDYNIGTDSGEAVQYEIVDFSDSAFYAVPDGEKPVSIISEDNNAGWVYFDTGEGLIYEMGSTTATYTTETVGPQNITTTADNGGGNPDTPGTPDTPQDTAPVTTTTAPPVTTTTPAPQQPITTTQAPQQPIITSAPQQPVITTTPAPAPPVTTAAPTTAPTAQSYTNKGDMYFASSQISVHVGEAATVSVILPLGSQRRVSFVSKNPSVASAVSQDGTSVRITGVSSGQTWIQATSTSGDVAYCEVNIVDTADEVISLVNAERRKYGLNPVVRGGAQLQQMANTRLREIELSFSHTRPNGKRFNTAADDIGLAYTYLGENLAMGQTSPQQVMKEWMASPSHRENILNRNYTELCVAYEIAPNGYYYWTQAFRTP